MILAGGRNPVPGRGGPPGPSARHSLALAACSTWQPVIWQPPGSPRHGPSLARHGPSLPVFVSAAHCQNGVTLGRSSSCARTHRAGAGAGARAGAGVGDPSSSPPAPCPPALGDTVMNTRMTYLHGSQLIQNSCQLSRLFPGESMRSSAGMSARTKCNQTCTRD